jgi:hypothetical protein
MILPPHGVALAGDRHLHHFLAPAGSNKKPAERGLGGLEAG